MKNLFYILAFVFCLPFMVSAQDAEPTLFADDLYKWSADIYFPQEIEFTLTALRRESAIASLELLVSYRGSDLLPIVIDPLTLTETDIGGVFRYIWTIPSVNPPRLFSPIRYEWTITNTNGATFQITESIEFVDHRVDWVKGNDLQSQVNLFHGNNQLDVNQVRQGIRATYNLLFAEADEKPLLTLLVYPDSVPIGCNIDDEGQPFVTVRRPEGREPIACDMSLANRIYELDDYIVVQQTNADTLQQTIISLLVEYRYVRQWGEVSVPSWFLYGLQQFYDPRPKNSALQIAQLASRSGDVLTLDELNNLPDEDNREIWQAQSTGLILYLADSLGVQGLYDFADAIAQYETFDEAYSEEVEQPLEVLILLWQDWLFGSFTQRIYAFNPYIADNTPTPTATNTPTNTPTVTFTPSKTPNVTRTLRPSVTPIPPTPTITPLPAQSFSVQPTDVPPTPIPQEPEPVFTVDDELITRAGIGGAVILGLLVILYFVLRRR